MSVFELRPTDWLVVGEREREREREGESDKS